MVSHGSGLAEGAQASGPALRAARLEIYSRHVQECQPPCHDSLQRTEARNLQVVGVRKQVAVVDETKSLVAKLGKNEASGGYDEQTAEAQRNEEGERNGGHDGEVIACESAERESRRQQERITGVNQSPQAKG